MSEEVPNVDDSIDEKVVDLINNAMYVTKDNEKVNFLKQAQELVIHHDILDNFLDEILGFQSDKSVEVKKFVIGFIEAACKKDPEFFPKVIINLNMLLNELNANVVKRAIQAATQTYKAFLKWICKAKITDILESTWEAWSQIKQHIFSLLDSTDNDGVRTQCVKFMEMIVICQTRKDQWSTDEEFNIDCITNNKLIDADNLEDEAKQVFEQLITYHGASHISSVNLMATMQTLVLIGRQRSQLFLSKVIQALEALHANLPPTLAKSQVNSVRKQMKLQLLIILKHPATVTMPQYQQQITQLLNDLGAGQSEINKCLQENKKRSLKSDNSANVKRIKLEADDEEEENDFVILPPKISRSEANAAIEMTAEDLIPRLSIIENVCDLVLVSMLSLPDTMPAHFQASYTPVSAAGTSSQIKHLARLMASRLTSEGYGKGVEEMVSKMITNVPKKFMKNEQQVQEQQQKIAIVIGKTIGQELKKQEQQKQIQQQKVKLTHSGKSHTGTLKLKHLNLAEITKELSDDVKERMTISSINRILKEDKKAYFSSSQLETRVKILAILMSEFYEKNPTICALIQNYIFDDIRNRHDIAFNTIYNEYVLAKTSDGNMMRYSQFLSKTLQNFIQRSDVKDRDNFLLRFFTEVPLLTGESIELLKNFILSEQLYSSCVVVGINILKAIIEKKRKQKEKALDVLLDLCLVVDKAEVRSFAIKTTKCLYEIWGGDTKDKIANFATKVLNYLLESKPPDNIIQENNQLWTEDNIKVCLFLYLSLLPINHKLIHNLAEVYVGTSPDTKRIILRVLEGPVKGMGMNSPELLLLVENCPKGAETLVTRIIHVLTDKQVPSAELVSRVRDLYHKRVADVRFLIPVLNGLSKKEVIAALPKLIKLNPIVVKEVFNRLLGAHVESGTNFQSPLTPSDLLIALHNIDPSECDMKTIIKATGLCFAEKNIYTPEVLAVVMQLLMDQNPLPTLLMRTVIQSLSQYPRLIGFVMNILQRLIMKQVWKQKKVWEGFIKCCQRTKPQSFQVLLQLPAPQLETVFSTSPDLKPALQQHVQAFTDHQRSHISQSILDVIFAPDQNDNPDNKDNIVIKEEENLEEEKEIPTDSTS